MPFPDLAGNLLLNGSSSNFLGFSSSDEDILDKNRIYDMHIKGLRQADKKTLFWKRFCEGPDETWKLLEANIDRLLTLFNIEEIEDEYLKYAIKLVGWTHDLKTITDKLDNNALRRLLAYSVSLWKRRGVAGGMIEILNLIIGVDAWEWDWFDKRFIVGEARHGFDQQGSDAYFLSEVGRRETNLRIVDPLLELDHELIAEIVQLWRPSGERILITYINFFDRFNDDSKGWATEGVGVPSPIPGNITNEVLNIPELTIPDTGLVFHSSPVIAESYPGTGTEVVNIAPAGNSEIGNFNGNAAFTDGLFEFDADSGDIEWSPFSGIDDIYSGIGTVLIWTNARSAGEVGNGRIISKGDGGSVGWGISLSGASPNLTFFSRSTGTSYQYRLNASEGAFSYSEDVLVSIEWDSDDPGTLPVIRVNGIAQVVVVLIAGTGSYPSDAGGSLYQGNRNGDNLTLDGFISDVALYDRALSDEEHEAFYYATLANKSAPSGAGTLDAVTAYPTSSDLTYLEDYSVTARVKFNGFIAGGTKDAHIAVVARNFSFPDGVFAEFRMEDPDFSEVHLTLNHITFVSADITRDHGIILQPDTYYTLRIEIFKLNDTEAFVTAYIDGIKVAETVVPSDGVSPSHVHQFGKPSVACGYQVTAQCDMFEVVPLPGKNTYVGINGEITDT